MTPGRLSEATALHAGILHLALGADESRAYWAHVDPTVPRAERPQVAFEERWLGPKSLGRLKTLLRLLARRFDPFPQALDVLRRWSPMDPVDRRLICHWHVQLTDPIYRAFTGEYLPGRRSAGRREVYFDGAQGWVRRHYPDRWAPATEYDYASKLLSAAFQAGLLASRHDPRALVTPRVSPLALGYALYLLRSLEFEGTLLDNPYLRSVGLEGEALAARLQALPGVRFRRMGHLQDLDWQAPDLAAWFTAQRGSAT